MKMTSLNISLPEPLKVYVETKVATGDYGTPSEYIRELIRFDKQGRLRRLEAELLEAVSSGDIELSRGELKSGSMMEALRRKTGHRRR
ncbi:MAG: ribbon-helix-helix domain-containing protein [Acidobacteriaceae bacterium]